MCGASGVMQFCMWGFFGCGVLRVGISAVSGRSSMENVRGRIGCLWMCTYCCCTYWYLLVWSNFAVITTGQKKFNESAATAAIVGSGGNHVVVL